MTKVGLVIGHNKKEQGAYAKALGCTEWQYYNRFVEILKRLDPERFDVYRREPDETYGAEMRKVLKQISESGENYPLIIELHFNSVGEPSINGTEVLSYKDSKVGIPIGFAFIDTICKEYKTKNRGIKGITNKNDRGGYGIMESKEPYILIEPFYGSNDEEAKKFKDVEKFAKIFIDFIKKI